MATFKELNMEIAALKEQLQNINTLLWLVVQTEGDAAGDGSGDEPIGGVDRELWIEPMELKKDAAVRISVERDDNEILTVTAHKV